MKISYTVDFGALRPTRSADSFADAVRLSGSGGGHRIWLAVNDRGTALVLPPLFNRVVRVESGGRTHEIRSGVFFGEEIHVEGSVAPGAPTLVMDFTVGVVTWILEGEARVIYDTEKR